MKRLLCLLAALAVLLPRGHAAEPRCVALTFDDGPSGALTERLLDGLAARGVHATFFLCGYRIDLYPELAARIAAEGHETGTHGGTCGQPSDSTASQQATGDTKRPRPRRYHDAQARAKF